MHRTPATHPLPLGSNATSLCQTAQCPECMQHRAHRSSLRVCVLSAYNQQKCRLRPLPLEPRRDKIRAERTQCHFVPVWIWHYAVAAPSPYTYEVHFSLALTCDPVFDVTTHCSDSKRRMEAMRTWTPNKTNRICKNVNGTIRRGHFLMRFWMHRAKSKRKTSDNRNGASIEWMHFLRANGSVWSLPALCILQCCGVE